jgi:hypothetical protein
VADALGTGPPPPQSLSLSGLWDGLGAYRSRAMRGWLVVGRLPAYPPDLNPSRDLWANLKDQELANLSYNTLGEVIQAAWHGIKAHPTGGCRTRPATFGGFQCGDLRTL